MLLYKNGRLDDAIERMEKAVKAKPDAPASLYNLGVMYGEKGDYAKAKQSLQACLKYINSTAYTRINLAMYPEIYMGAATNLGLIHTRSGMYDEAVKVLKAAIEFKADDVNANLNLANAYYLMGDMEKAIAQMRKCLKLVPGNAELHNALGLIYHNKNSTTLLWMSSRQPQS